jgi:two-component system chemotaxis sensor kinase CheA
MDALATARLIFRPSFSTQDNVTETSGRGVGMDAVRTCVEELGGKVDVEVYGESGVAYAPWALLIELPETIMINRREPQDIPVAIHKQPA